MQRDPLGAVRVPDPLDHDLGVGSRRDGDPERADEPRAVRTGHPRLHRERFVSGHPQKAPGEQPPAGVVEALQAVAGQLAVLRGDRQSR